MNTFLLWLAQGFGIGRIPVAPGTFGSVLGLLWFALLLWPQSLWIFLGGTVTGLFLSVWLCGVGERVLNQTDPGSVVLDEVTAIPVCFISAVLFPCFSTGGIPSLAVFFSKQGWLATAGVFVLFRIFDVWKPWPVRQLQSLKGGWGVTADDVFAAVYVNLIVWACYSLGILGESRNAH